MFRKWINQYLQLKTRQVELPDESGRCFGLIPKRILFGFKKYELLPDFIPKSKLVLNPIKSSAKFFLMAVLITCQGSYSFSGNRVNNFLLGKDSLKSSKSWIASSLLPQTAADSISLLLRQTNPIFTEKWVHDELFVYSDSKYSDLPDTLDLPLLKSGEKFYFNWYGAMNSPFGPRWGVMHRGLDLDLVTGDTLVSSFDGIVRYARYNDGGYGNCVIVRHLNGLETLYGHLSQINVKENQFVKAGNFIGLGGSSGKSEGPHLHFETRYKDFSFDPYLIVDSEKKILKGETVRIFKKDILHHRYPSEEPRVQKKHVKSKRKGKYAKGKSRKSRAKKYVHKRKKKTTSSTKKIVKKTVSKKKSVPQKKSVSKSKSSSRKKPMSNKNKKSGTKKASPQKKKSKTR